MNPRTAGVGAALAFAGLAFLSLQDAADEPGRHQVLSERSTSRTGSDEVQSEREVAVSVDSPPVQQSSVVEDAPLPGKHDEIIDPFSTPLVVSIPHRVDREFVIQSSDLSETAQSLALPWRREAERDVWHLSGLTELEDYLATARLRHSIGPHLYGAECIASIIRVEPVPPEVKAAGGLASYAMGLSEAAPRDVELRVKKRLAAFLSEPSFSIDKHRGVRNDHGRARDYALDVASRRFLSVSEDEPRRRIFRIGAKEEHADYRRSVQSGIAERLGCECYSEAISSIFNYVNPPDWMLEPPGVAAKMALLECTLYVSKRVDYQLKDARDQTLSALSRGGLLRYSSVGGYRFCGFDDVEFEEVVERARSYPALGDREESLVLLSRILELHRGDEVLLRGDKMYQYLSARLLRTLDRETFDLNARSRAERLAGEHSFSIDVESVDVESMLAVAVHRAGVGQTDSRLGRKRQRLRSEAQFRAAVVEMRGVPVVPAGAEGLNLIASAISFEVEPDWIRDAGGLRAWLTKNDDAD